MHPDPDLIALGIRQPWAELILRGVKTIEVRSLPTTIRGTIYIYTGKKLASNAAADTMLSRHELNASTLVSGRLVGTVEITDSRPCGPRDADAACVPASMLKGQQAWCLANPERLETPLEVRYLPYGVWFYPFKRRNGQSC